MGSVRPRGEGYESRNNQSRYRHPILDLYAKDAESLNEYMQGRLPPVARKVRTANREIYYFYIYSPERLSWRPLSFTKSRWPRARQSKKKRPQLGGQAEAVLSGLGAGGRPGTIETN
jgi:hypothetical protein